MKHLGTINLFMCAAMLLAAKASAEDAAGYPADWPLPVASESGQCPNISGIYRLKASRSKKVEKSNRVERLDGLLFVKYLVNSPEYVAVNHSSAENKLTLSLPSEPAPEVQGGYRIVAGEAKCNDGWIEVTQTRSWHSEGTSHSTQSQSKLRILSDGSLVAYHRFIRKSRTLILFSYGDDVDNWHIFERQRL